MDMTSFSAYASKIIIGPAGQRSSVEKFNGSFISWDADDPRLIPRLFKGPREEFPAFGFLSITPCSPSMYETK